MDRLLRFLLETFIRRGTFRVTTSRGTVLTFGDGTGRPVSVRFTTRAAEWGILLDPELKLGECYMNGTFVVEQGTIADVLAKHPGETLLSLVIGGQLMLALAILGYGRTAMGRFGDSQAAGVQLAMQIIGGLVVGLLAGEWRGVPRRPKIQICAAILVLLVGAVLIKYAETM